MKPGFQVREPGLEERGVFFGGAHDWARSVGDAPLSPVSLLFRSRVQKSCLVTQIRQ